jgi:hypothetical protein
MYMVLLPPRTSLQNKIISHKSHQFTKHHYTSHHFTYLQITQREMEGIVVPLYHVGITTFICKEGLGEIT